MAMTVMAIGASAVISMQRASVQGNLDARETDVANSIARTWMERLQREAMMWTVPGRSNPGGASNILADGVLQQGIDNAGQWFLPTKLNGTKYGTPLSPAFDILGRDVDPANAIFCANVRLTPMTTANNLFRADVRVLWPRAITTTVAACDAATQVKPDPIAYHAIYTTACLKGNPQ